MAVGGLAGRLGHGTVEGTGVREVDDVPVRADHEADRDDRELLHEPAPPRDDDHDEKDWEEQRPDELRAEAEPERHARAERARPRPAEGEVRRHREERRHHKVFSAVDDWRTTSGNEPKINAPKSASLSLRPTRRAIPNTPSRSAGTAANAGNHTYRSSPASSIVQAWAISALGGFPLMRMSVTCGTYDTELCWIQNAARVRW